MKAAVNTTYGSPEVINIRDIETPEPDTNEVRIRIHYTTVNRTDAGIRGVEYFVSRFFTGFFKPKFQVMGGEFSGVIDAVGAQTTRYKVGDKVFGINSKSFGAHAEYICLAEDGPLALLPDNLPMASAPAICEGPWLADIYLRAFDVQQGDNVLVYGASGSIGSSAVQLAKHHYGARVVAVCGSNAVELVKDLGADVVIDYQKQDYTAMNEQFDYVFDAVGKTTFGRVKHLMKPGARFSCTEFGPWGQNVWFTLLGPLMGSRRVLFPLPKETNHQLVKFEADLAAAGKLRPVVDRTYPFEEIIAATRYVETGQKVGSVVVKMPVEVE